MPSQMSCFHVLTAGRISATSRCCPAPNSAYGMFYHHHHSSSSTPFLVTLPSSLAILPAVCFASKHSQRLNSKPSRFSRPRNNIWPHSPPYMNACHHLRLCWLQLGCLHFAHMASTLCFMVDLAFSGLDKHHEKFFTHTPSLSEVRSSLSLQPRSRLPPDILSLSLSLTSHSLSHTSLLPPP